MLEKIEDLGIPASFIIFLFLAIVVGTLYNVSPGTLWGGLFFIVRLAPLWLPPILLFVFWKLWVRYVRARFFRSQKHILLEIRIPTEITKSPLAMEAVLSGMHQGVGETTFIDRYWYGKTRTWYSFEIASIEGEVRFFIWTRSFFKNIVEAQIYAQYPEVEVYEADDYTRGVFSGENTSVWGCDLKLSKPDPYPIKTYIDYGLDKDPKEEQKVDPLANLLEFFGGIGKGHTIWLQIIVRANKNTLGQKDLRKEAQAEIDRILLRDPKTKGSRQVSSAGFPILPTISKGEQDVVASVERNMHKLQFDVGIRGIYIAEKEKFHPANIVGLLGTIKQFNSNTLNGFIPTRWNTSFNYPWQDFREILHNRSRRGIIEAYKLRSWFFEPFKTPSFVMSTEELATIFHFPSRTVQTPTLSRVGSKKVEAPPNLPI